MSNKVLAIADLHFGLYRLAPSDKVEIKDYEGFRLNQYDRLANALCTMIRKRDLRELWICGDLLMVPKSAPRVMFALKSFVEKVSAVCPVKIILGNHDLEVKSLRTPLADYLKSSLVTLLESGQVSIISSEVIPYTLSDGSTVKVAFQSWRPNNQLPSQAELGADYLVCHGDVDPKISPFTDHLIPLENYRRVLAGHIHIAKDTEQFSSIGTPFPHSFADSPHTSLLIFDLLTNQVERIPTDQYFLKFVKQSSEQHAQSKGQGAEGKDGAPVVVRIEDNTKADFNLSWNATKDAFLAELSPFAQSIVRKVTGQNNSNLNTAANLSFVLKEIHIKNFLSIQSMDLDFTKYQGLTILKGDNGAGKTSIFRAIQYAFMGKLPGYVKSSLANITTGKDPKITLSFDYNGSSYQILRSSNKLEFLKDGKVIDGFTKKDVQSLIEKELPFLEFFSIIMVEQSSSGIFSDLSSNLKISLLSRLLGLETIQKWTEALDQEIEDLEAETDKKRMEQNTLVAKIESNENFIDMNKGYTRIEIDPTVLVELTQRKDQVNAQIIELNHKITAAATAKAKREMLIEQKSQKQEELQAAQQELSSLEDIVQVEPPVLPSPQTQQLAEACEVELKKLTTIQQELKQLKSHPDICPTCKREWRIENLEGKIADLTTKYEQQSAVHKQAKAQYTKAQQADNQAQNEYCVQLEKNKLLAKQRQSLEKKIAQCQKILATPLMEVDSTDYQSKIDVLNQAIKELDVQIVQQAKRAAEAKTNNDIVAKLEKLRKENAQLKEDLKDVTALIADNDKYIDELTKFNRKVFTDKGLLVARLLEDFVEKLNSDHELKVETIRTTQSGNNRPTLNIMLFNSQLQTYVDYQYLSGGQRLIADLRFLKGLLRTLPNPPMVLLLDEVFKFFDDNAILAASDILKDIRNSTGSIFLILHGSLQQTVGDNIIELEMTDQGTVIV